MALHHDGADLVIDQPASDVKSPEDVAAASLSSDEDGSYGVGTTVASLGWLVRQTIDRSIVEAPLDEFKDGAYSLAGALAALVAGPLRRPVLVAREQAPFGHGRSVQGAGRTHQST